MTPKRKPKLPFNPKEFLAEAGTGKTISDFAVGQNVFSQGDTANAIYYILRGKIKLSVVSKTGREAVIAILGPEQFFGENCLAGPPTRLESATAISEAKVMRVEKQSMVRLLHAKPAFSELFIAHLLSRTIRVQEDLVDQLFNSSEKRLARVLLLLANFGKEGQPELLIPKISQETLAEMVGTTRSRVSFFMNKFRKLGFIEYNDGLHVHSSLLNVILLDQEPAGPGRTSLLANATSANKKE